MYLTHRLRELHAELEYVNRAIEALESLAEFRERASPALSLDKPAANSGSAQMHRRLQVRGATAPPAASTPITSATIVLR